MSFTGGMKPEQASGPAKEVAVEMHEAMTLEELKEAIKEKEEEAQKLYDVAYDLFVVSGKLYSTCLCGGGGLAGWGWSSGIVPWEWKVQHMDSMGFGEGREKELRCMKQ